MPITIEKRRNEDAQSMCRRLKKEIWNSGILKTCSDNRYYIKPSEIKNRKNNKLKRLRKLNKKQEEKKELERKNRMRRGITLRKPKKRWRKK